MARDGETRRLAAILMADVVGYSRLMADDEAATVRTLEDYRAIMAEHIEAHEGRVVDAAGDALLAEFASPVEALSCAAEIQRKLATRNSQLAGHRRMDMRIGIDLSDVLEKDGALYGDGVNVAARLESLAEPGGICLSAAVHDQVVGKVEIGFEDLGEQHLKNIDRPVRVHRALLGGVAASRAAGASRPAPRPSWLVDKI